MPKIQVTTRDGQQRVLDGDANKKVMEVIRDNGIDEVEAMCGGSCACATCHVYVHSSFADLLPAVSEDEQILPEGAEHYQPQASRLSCQIRLSPECDGLKLTVAPEG